MRRFKLLVVITGLLMTAFVTLTFAQDYEPDFFEHDCIFGELDGVTCGTLIVPEDRNDPEGNTVEIAVAFIEAAGDAAAEPIIYLEGGPGGGAIYGIEYFFELPIHENHDIILFDQRGTGFSLPSLNCYESEDGESEDPLADCYTRLADEGVNVSRYTSQDAADDIADLVYALDYDQVNLYGISYGTRLALTVVREYPEIVRSVVLDGVFSPEINSEELDALNTVEAFQRLFDGCAADPDCNAAFPDLEADFYEMVERFNAEPPVFEYDDGYEVADIELYGDDVANALFQTLYDGTAIPLLPYGITALAYAETEEEYSDAYDIVSGWWSLEAYESGEMAEVYSIFEDAEGVLDFENYYGDVSDSEGLYASVGCAEEIPFEDLNAARDYADLADPAIQDWLIVNVESAFGDCDVWQVEASDPVESELVEGDLPVLLLSGAYDPITPVSFGDSALAGLPNGIHVILPNGGHGDSYSPGCAADLTAAFFDAPDEELDTSCVDDLSIEWYTDF